MMLRRSALAALLLAAAPAAAQQGDLPADPGPRVDALFTRFAGASSPGCAVGVTVEGRPVLARAYGMADLEHDVPNSPSTVFEAGSVSKQFTAAAVVLLAQDGRLALDDDARRYLPELPDYGTPITIRHLLTHTSGLRDWGSVAALEGWPRGSRVHAHPHVLDIVSRQRSLNYPPGEYYSYTNSGYNLLAVLVERVSGMPFADFTRTRVFEPLGMRDTRWRDDFTAVVKNRASAYRPAPAPGGGFRLDMPFENVHGNGGLLTTVSDLLLWTESLRTGKGHSDFFLREMHRQARLNGGREIEYAGGLFVTRHGEVPEVGHSGSTGGYRAYLARWPEQRLAVGLLCNAAHANPTALARGVADVFLGTRAESPRAASVPAPALAARAGVYRDTRTRTPLRLEVQGGELRMDGRTALVPLSDTRFAVGRQATLHFDAAPAAGRRSGFRLIGSDGDTLRYEPEPDFRPTPAQLSEYAGVYESDEAQATYTVAAEGGRLVLVDRYGERRPLDPAYADVFEGQGGAYRFVRDASGRVTELSMISGRVWDMRFRRR